MTVADMAPAIGGFLLGSGLWGYALYLRRKLRAERAADKAARAL